MKRRKPTAVQRMFMIARGAKAYHLPEHAYRDMLLEMGRAMQKKAEEAEPRWREAAIAFQERREKLQDLKRQAQQAWEATEVEAWFDEDHYLWVIKLGGGKSLATSGAYSIVFTAETVDDVIAKAIAAAPPQSMEQLKALAIANAGEP